MFAVCLQTSFTIPPVGFALFYITGVAPRGIDIKKVYIGVFLFIVLKANGIASVLYMPGLVT